MYDDDHCEYRMVPPVQPRTNSIRAILGSPEDDDPGLLDRALEDFISKNDDYDDASDALGIVGQVSDLWRKIVKLKKAVIDQKPLNGETVDRLIRDIFGHSLLAMHYEQQQAARDALAEMVQESSPARCVTCHQSVPDENQAAPATADSPGLLNFIKEAAAQAFSSAEVTWGEMNRTIQEALDQSARSQIEYETDELRDFLRKEIQLAKSQGVTWEAIHDWVNEEYVTQKPLRRVQRQRKPRHADDYNPFED